MKGNMKFVLLAIGAAAAYLIFFRDLVKTGAEPAATGAPDYTPAKL